MGLFWIFFMAAPKAEPVSIALKAGKVSGLIVAPKDARACYVMAHGAGAGMTHPFMASVASGFAERGIATLRYQFPYMEAGGKRPDAPPVAHAAVRAAVDAARKRFPKLPLFAGLPPESATAAMTDEGGFFSICPLAVGDYLVTAVSEGYFPLVVPARLAGASTDLGDLPLRPGAASLIGVVQGPAGPVAGATVIAHDGRREVDVGYALAPERHARILMMTTRGRNRHVNESMRARRRARGPPAAGHRGRSRTGPRRPTSRGPRRRRAAGRRSPGPHRHRARGDPALPLGPR